MPPSNLFSAIPNDRTREQFIELLRRSGLRVERIVSFGQASPAAFWYEQSDGEWLLLISGAARIRFADENSDRELRPGDHLDIAPRRRHRVQWTAPDEATIWLAVHYAQERQPS